MAFRFVFIGSTATLREFLNRLADSALPVAVRGVEGELATASETGPPAESLPSAPPSLVLGAEETAVDPAVPVVVPALSRFTVTVESIRLVSGPTVP